MAFKVTDGYLIFVEGNEPDNQEWFTAKPWQAEEFVKVMRFDEMKSMGGYPLPKEETKPFKKNGFTYRFIIHNEWGPCYMENMDTGKVREIRYLDMNSKTKKVPYDDSPPKAAKTSAM